MKYYNLNGEFLDKVTGCDNRQILTPENYLNYNDPNSFTNLGSFKNGEIHFFEIDMPLMEINRNAFLLDLLQSSVMGDCFQGITIKKELFEFLLNFGIQNFQMYKMNLFQIHGKEKVFVTDYLRFVLVETAFKYIDFINSSFIFTEFNFKTGQFDIVERIKFNSNDQFMNYFLNTVPVPIKRFFKIEKAVFSKEMCFDLFCLPRFNGYMVSEKLKNAIEAEGFTGMRFEEAPNIIRED
ncbi:MAG: hypothetical protein IPH57_16375 [Saprospiraceae bacterium]|nr:hypothetical protein [Saprospiraceae bacterium]